MILLNEAIADLTFLNLQFPRTGNHYFIVKSLDVAHRNLANFGIRNSACKFHMQGNVQNGNLLELTFKSRIEIRQGNGFNF